MQVRLFRSADASDLAAIFFSATRRIASHYYSEEQINAWAPTVPEAERFIQRGADGRLVLVAVTDTNEPLAYGDLEEDGHIDHLYCRPEVAGTGVASTLFDNIEAPRESVDSRAFSLRRVSLPVASS